MCSSHFGFHENVPCLTEEFDRLGLTDFFDGLDFSENVLDTIERMWNRFDSAHQVIARLLIMGEAVELNQAQGYLVSSVLHLLEPLGVLKKSGNKVSLSGFSLVRYRGVWLFADAPQSSPTLYFGPDSVALACRLRPLAGGKALDLCSGPGIQALILAQSGMTVTAADINPIASELCRFNAKINGLTGRVNAVSGDLYNAIDSSEKFDLIVANPPLIPIPSGISYPFVGNGGPDGLSLTTRILSEAGSRITPLGTVLVIGMTILNKGRIISIKNITEALTKAKLRGVITLIASFDTSCGSHFVQSIRGASSTGHIAGEINTSRERTEAQVADGYRLLETDEVSTFLLRAWPEDCRQAPRLSVQDFSGTGDEQNVWKF